MGYSTRHLGGSGDEDPPLSSLANLYDELRGADGEHTDVSVTNDETGWTLSAFQSGLVVYESLSDMSSETTFHMPNVSREQVIEMWTALAKGQLDMLKTYPWKPGYR